MTCFVDTSAFLAVLDRSDTNHPKAKEEWESLLINGNGLVTTSYILVETFALIQHRFGIEAVRIFHEDICPVLRIEWVDESTHDAGITGVLSASRKGLSLVDCVSFNVMRRLGIKTVFAFDAHFTEQGFACIPGSRK